jgi:hypothetical protein
MSLECCAYWGIHSSLLFLKLKLVYFFFRLYLVKVVMCSSVLGLGLRSMGYIFIFGSGNHWDTLEATIWIEMEKFETFLNSYIDLYLYKGLRALNFSPIQEFKLFKKDLSTLP